MADPVTLSLGASAARGVFAGLSGRAQARAEQQQAKVNAYIGRTRAIQTDTVARANLDSELGSFRAASTAMGRPGVGVLDMMREIGDIRERERRIEVGNRMQESRDFAQEARNARVRGRTAMVSGVMQAAPSLFDLYEYRRA
jgi:hypothetical protein